MKGVLESLNMTIIYSLVLLEACSSASHSHGGESWTYILIKMTFSATMQYAVCHCRADNEAGLFPIINVVTCYDNVRNVPSSALGFG